MRDRYLNAVWRRLTQSLLLDVEISDEPVITVASFAITGRQEGDPELPLDPHHVGVVIGQSTAFVGRFVFSPRVLLTTPGSDGRLAVCSSRIASI